MSVNKTNAGRSVLARVGRFLWGVFFLVIFFGGWLVIAFFAGGESMIDYVRVKAWEENICTVRSAKMVVQNHGSSTAKNQKYQLQTSYRYTVDGKQYVGDRYGVSDNATSEFKGVAKAEKYLKSNSQVTCFFNPKNPAESIIDRSFTGSILFVLLPLAFVFLFGGLMLANMGKGKRNRF